jgi:hypothetical protein
MKENKWIRLLAYVTGLVNQERLLQNDTLSRKPRNGDLCVCSPDNRRAQIGLSAGRVDANRG